MSEKTLRKRLNRITILVAVVSVLIIVAGGVFLFHLRGVMQDILTEQMKSNSEQYKITVRRQIEGDIQTLNTLSGFLRYEKMDTESFVKGLLKSEKYTDFERVGYFGKSGKGILVTTESQTAYEFSKEQLDEKVQDVVEKAWRGKSGISQIYHPEENTGRGENAFAYAVPVYDEDDVVGALVAGVSTERFEDLLQDATFMNGQGYIHMISDTGTFLVRSENRVVKEVLDTIYENDYISPKEQKRIREALAEGELCMSEFTYKDETYQILLNPLEVNGWYLFCVQTAKSVNSRVYRLMTISQGGTMAVLFALLLLIIYGYQQIYRSNHRLIKSAWYDPVTGAHNMARFEQEISSIIENSREYSLMALNVRQFKFFNEIFGSFRGDRLLCYIKKVIDAHTHDGEYFCRGGDDLFYILFRDTDRTVIQGRLEEMIEEISQYAGSNRENYQIMLYCGGVIGTEVNDKDPSVQRSMTHVKFALNTARQSMKENIWFYDTRLHEDEKLENYVESHMHSALEKGEFQLYLQPKTDLKTGRISGAEALVRWTTEDGRMIYPDQFVPVFEKSGMCSVLDMYMVEKVCAQIRAWMDQGLEPVPLSVNQSKLVFYEADYVTNMKALLEKYRISASLITLEILEGLAMKNTEELNERLESLTQMGFQVSMDDFGSGYSSLNTLASLKIDELKLDRAFLLRLQDPREDYDRQITIMNKIVELTKALGIKTVVEGIESAEDEELVREMGCDQGQGYYYSKPVSAEEFSEKYM